MLSLLMLSGAPAWADTIITYTGRNFIYFDDLSGHPSTLYNSSDHLSITLDLAAPLGANLNSNGGVANVALLAWSVSDGLHAWASTDCTNANACNGFAQFSTDANGAITQWHFQAWQDTVNAESSTSGDAAWVAGIGIGRVNTPGTWSVPANPTPPASVPEPSTLSLLGLSILLPVTLKFWGRLRQREACKSLLP